mmetsp:Transcript_10709/g.37339  ORF Transcript_10709/g.37339 Transcript_10709/m.37339 type:complete len:221 (-) Transcript_10709:79-741(-)
MAAVVAAREFVRRLQHPLTTRRAILALDIGDTTTGVALLRDAASARATSAASRRHGVPDAGDATRPRAEPVGTIWCAPHAGGQGPTREAARRKYATDVARQVKLLSALHGAGGLVVGWPLEVHGTEGRRCRFTRQFVDDMARVAGGLTLPVLLWDERYSTAAAAEALAAMAPFQAAPPGDDRRTILNALSAVAILQDFVDSLPPEALGYGEAEGEDAKRG